MSTVIFRCASESAGFGRESMMQGDAESSVRVRISELGWTFVYGLHRHWRLVAGLALVGAGVVVAQDLSDTQGRGDIPSGYAVRMTCEPDPESALWSGGCDRVAGDIAREDKPSFGELYHAFL